MESNNEVSSCSNIGTISNDIVLNISSHLGSKDLVSLALTCRRFGIVKNDHKNSLVNKAAQDIINSKWTSDNERQQIPKYDDESWIELYRELEVLRSPLVFGKLVGSDIELVNNNKQSVQVISFGNSTAIGNQIMRAGKHHVTFKCTGDMIGVSLGIIRPTLLDWENLVCKKTKRWGNCDIHYCALYLETGRCHFRNGEGKRYSFPHWIGNYLNPASEKMCHIGMTIDIDEGSLTLFKDGQRLGKMRNNLSGEYCWLVRGEATLSQGHTRVSIERGNNSPAFHPPPRRRRRFRNYVPLEGLRSILHYAPEGI